ncbi:hypothetical protein [Paucibacter sp. Y2R2-4]|uniref:hypothetical protein n=1 Tax=Paucibacter sp. Y2R2-4 TaxID=2893553 RepID=UPI0021E401C9|nr:hypothetical protein [Paucibacter sp. Y2R2-4]MCV2349002.1 hypothetical protein [Paucibacter sp. Y2R2-4]
MSGARVGLLCLGALLALQGCGERSQKLDGKQGGDTTVWSVSEAANPAFVAPGWKAGDKAAWEAQIRHRNQAQNDYSR